MRPPRLCPRLLERLFLIEPLRAFNTHLRSSRNLQTDDHEIDAVVSLPDGRWAGIEVRLVGEYAYRRKDGVFVIPLALLGP